MPQRGTLVTCGSMFSLRNGVGVREIRVGIRLSEFKRPGVWALIWGLERLESLALVLNIQISTLDKEPQQSSVACSHPSLSSLICSTPNHAKWSKTRSLDHESYLERRRSALTALNTAGSFRHLSGGGSSMTCRHPVRKQGLRKTQASRLTVLSSCMLGATHQSTAGHKLALASFGSASQRRQPNQSHVFYPPAFGLFVLGMADMVVSEY